MTKKNKNIMGVDPDKVKLIKFRVSKKLLKALAERKKKKKFI